MIEESMKYLDQAFNPHNIYFIRTNSENKCINYIDEDFYFNLGASITGIPHMLTYYDHDDGINLYYFQDFPDTGSGKTYSDKNGKPANVVYLVGSENGTSVGRSLGVAHEVGHCLGLCHTFQEPITLADNSNWLSSGDLIFDTPPDPDEMMGSHVDPVTCIWTNPNPITYANYHPRTSNNM